jgi:hypothetical protein
MQENYEIVELNEHLTDAEIIWAIRYLDPDLCAENAVEDTGTVVGISFFFVAVLTGALEYIGLYMRTQ